MLVSGTYGTGLVCGRAACFTKKNAAEIGIALGASRVSVIKQRRRRDEECRVCPLRVSTCCGELLSSEVWKLLVDEKRGPFRVSQDQYGFWD